MKSTRLIQRYELIATKCGEQKELLENMPVSLSYEIAKPSADSTPAKAQAKEEVLSGGIDTLKAYKERIKELEERERRTKEQLKQAECNKELAIKRAEEAENREPKVIEVNDEATINKLKRYEELFGDVSMYEGKTTRVTNGDAITYTALEFSEDVRKFIEKYGHLTHFAREFNEMINEGKEEYTKAINDMFRFLNKIERNINNVEATIINE